MQNKQSLAQVFKLLWSISSHQDVWRGIRSDGRRSCPSGNLSRRIPRISSLSCGGLAGFRPTTVHSRRGNSTTTTRTCSHVSLAFSHDCNWSSWYSGDTIWHSQNWISTVRQCQHRQWTVNDVCTCQQVTLYQSKAEQENFKFAISQLFQPYIFADSLL